MHFKINLYGVFDQKCETMTFGVACRLMGDPTQEAHQRKSSSESTRNMQSTKALPIKLRYYEKAMPQIPLLQNSNLNLKVIETCKTKSSRHKYSCINLQMYPIHFAILKIYILGHIQLIICIVLVHQHIGHDYVATLFTY